MTLPIVCECASTPSREDEYPGGAVTCPSCGTEVRDHTTTVTRESPTDPIAKRDVAMPSEHSLRATKSNERLYRVLGLAYLIVCVWFFARHYVFGGPS